MIQLLKKYRDIFAWIYEEMPGLDPILVTHKLAIEPMAKPVKQPPRNFRTEVQLQIKAEIEILIVAGFIRPCMHPQWLTNIVPIQRKND